VRRLRPWDLWLARAWRRRSRRYRRCPGGSTGVAGEFLDEHGAGDGAAAFAAADVLDIGDGSLNEFAVVVVDGHLPHFSPTALELARSLSVKGWSEPKTPTLTLASGNDDGTRERGGVNEMAWRRACLA